MEARTASDQIRQTLLVRDCAGLLIKSFTALPEALAQSKKNLEVYAMAVVVRSPLPAYSLCQAALASQFR
jgi:hypothetical protein